MCTGGQMKYMWNGPEVREPRVAVREFIPTDYVPGSARAPMGRRAAPYRHKQTQMAIEKRREREEAPPATLIVVSQLQVARKRAKRGVTNPAKASVLRRRGRAQLGVVEPMTEVFFVQPGPRRRAIPGRGQLLCFPDKKKLYCAIDRSGAVRRSRRMDLIEVVPRGDVWAA